LFGKNYIIIMKKTKNKLKIKKSSSTKKMTLFQHLDSLTSKKINFDPTNDIQAKSYDQYMINRFVSMIDLYIPIVNDINRFQLSKKTHFDYFKSFLPKKKHYFRYIKAGKEFNIEEKQGLCKYFECGIREAEGYIKVLSEEQIRKIVNLYNINN